MAVRPESVLTNAIIKTYTVVGGGSTTEYLPVKFSGADTTVTVCGAGDNGFAIALETKTAGEKVRVAVVTGGSIIPVKVGTGGATRDAYAKAAADGLTDQTLGGGTTVRYIFGKFLQSGVAGDRVGLLAGPFAGVSS